MDVRLKQRLIGASVLVLAVVLVVPEVLTGRPDTGLEEVSDGGAAAEETSALPNATQAVEITLVDLAPEEEPVPPEVLAPPPPPPVVEGPPESTSESTPSAPPEAVPPRPESGWAVQVAALGNEAAARAMAEDLQSRGYAAFVLEYRLNGKVYYRVRVGPEAQRDRAEALAGRLGGERFGGRALEPAVLRHP